MAVYREGNCVLTPGEYIENPWYFSALLVSSYDVDTVVLGYRLGEPFNPYPPATAGAFNRNVVGVVVMNDALDASQIGESVRLLRLAGANDICVVMESEEDITEQNLIQDIPMVTYGYEALREMLSVKE
jgi:ethanolamine utilization protein eutp